MLSRLRGVRFARSGTGKMRAMLVRRSRSCGSDRATGTSLLCDALPQPTGEAVQDGYLLLIKQLMPVGYWQLWFSRQLRAPSPRHASHLQWIPSKP